MSYFGTFSNAVEFSQPKEFPQPRFPHFSAIFFLSGPVALSGKGMNFPLLFSVFFFFFFNDCKWLGQINPSDSHYSSFKYCMCVVGP